jgi:hypothetical protein
MLFNSSIEMEIKDTLISILLNETLNVKRDGQANRNAAVLSRQSSVVSRHNFQIVFLKLR